MVTLYPSIFFIILLENGAGKLESRAKRKTSDVTARSRHYWSPDNPEKAGVRGSIPSLATSSFQTLTSIFVTEVCLCGVRMESRPS